jgi:hypothetical protein
MDSTTISLHDRANLLGVNQLEDGRLEASQATQTCVGLQEFPLPRADDGKQTWLFPSSLLHSQGFSLGEVSMIRLD